MNRIGWVVVVAALGGCSPAYLAGLAGRDAVAEREKNDPVWGPLQLMEPVETAVVYARLSGSPIPYEEIAPSYKDVRLAANEFERRDRLAAARGSIDATASRVAESKSLLVRIVRWLPEYDFARGGFATELEKSFVPFEPTLTNMTGLPYAIAFANGGDFAFAPVAEGIARAVIPDAYSRQAQIELEVQPLDAVSRPLLTSAAATRVVNVKILRMRLKRGAAVLSEVPARVAAFPSSAR
jgi:hypothetical protein